LQAIDDGELLAWAILEAYDEAELGDRLRVDRRDLRAGAILAASATSQRRGLSRLAGVHDHARTAACTARDEETAKQLGLTAFGVPGEQDTCAVLKRALGFIALHTSA
jgi:hypothetical protein